MKKIIIFLVILLAAFNAQARSICIIGLGDNSTVYDYHQASDGCQQAFATSGKWLPDIYLQCGYVVDDSDNGEKLQNCFYGAVYRGAPSWMKLKIIKNNCAKKFLKPYYLARSSCLEKCKKIGLPLLIREDQLLPRDQWPVYE
jgi:hypothetical protein